MKQTAKVPLAIFLSGLLLLVAVGQSINPAGHLASSEVGHILALFFKLDRIHLSAASPLDPKKVDVFWHGFVDSHGQQTIQIICKGAAAHPLPREYGENDFYVTYDGDEVISSVRQFKFAWWHFHTYSFTLDLDSSKKVQCKVAIDGPDQLMSK